MMLGMTPYTLVHVLLSLVGIASGFFVLFFGLLASRRLPAWTALFLVTTGLTSATGFGFPREHILPSHVVGAISLVVLAVALLALYRHKLAGGWRRIYVIAAVVSLYLNFFVLIVQGFLKIPVLHDLAPLQNEPPFVVAQGAALLLFVAAGALAVRRFHPEDRRE